jgi:hypothetical protein
MLCHAKRAHSEASQVTCRGGFTTFFLATTRRRLRVRRTAHERASVARGARSPFLRPARAGTSAAPQAVRMSSAKGANNPSNFLKTVLGRPVVVKLNSGVDYRGASLRPLPLDPF